MSFSDHRSESSIPREGWILYDGECGFCFRWVHLWKNVVERRGFALKDLQSAYSDGSLQVSPKNLLDDIRVLTPTAKLVSGADAYLYVTRRIWWAWPCRVSTGCFGQAIAGSIEIAIESRATVPCRNGPRMWWGRPRPRMCQVHSRQSSPRQAMIETKQVPPPTPSAATPPESYSPALRPATQSTGSTSVSRRCRAGRYSPRG